jgi:hypothetical protein
VKLRFVVHLHSKCASSTMLVQKESRVRPRSQHQQTQQQLQLLLLLLVTRTTLYHKLWKWASPHKLLALRYAELAVPSCALSRFY